MKCYIKTPLINYYSHPEVLMKAENLQPFGSYKIRGVQYFFEKKIADLRKKGLVVASAGNMAQAVAYFSKSYEINCTIYIPESAPLKKKKALQALEAKVVEKPFSEIWSMVLNDFQGDEIFLHPALTHELTEGYESIVYEILEQDSDIDAIVIPFGVGGLTMGILDAVSKLEKKVKVFTAELSDNAPLSAALKTGKSVIIQRKQSFVDAIGTPQVHPKVFDCIKERISESIMVSEMEATRHIQEILVQHSMVIEGAAAVSLIAAKKLLHQRKVTKVAAILTGGNIDLNLHSFICNENE